MERVKKLIYGGKKHAATNKHGRILRLPVKKTNQGKPLALFNVESALREKRKKGLE